MLYIRSLTTGRIIKMLKNVFQKQNGFTLVELLVTIAISAVFLTAVISFSRTSINLNTNISNDANATNQLKNAFNIA